MIPIGRRSKALKAKATAKTVATRAACKRYYEAHRTEIAAYNILRNYGVTLEQKAQLLEQQGGVCALCNKSSNHWVVDHDHSTGAVRGILCRSCNVTLGKLGDSVRGLDNWLTKARTYMNNYVIFDARLVAAPEQISTQGGKTFTKVRLADNPMGKKDDKRPARFVNGKAFGAQAEMINRLSQGDVISVSGELGVEAYTAKDGTPRTADVMVIQSFRVQKSETFFGAREAAPKQESSLDDLFGAP